MEGTVVLQPVPPTQYRMQYVVAVARARYHYNLLTTLGLLSTPIACRNTHTTGYLRTYSRLCARACTATVQSALHVQQQASSQEIGSAEKGHKQK
jgi:hypothetical protein